MSVAEEVISEVSGCVPLVSCNVTVTSSDHCMSADPSGEGVNQPSAVPSGEGVNQPSAVSSGEGVNQPSAVPSGEGVSQLSAVHSGERVNLLHSTALAASSGTIPGICPFDSLPTNISLVGEKQLVHALHDCTYVERIRTLYNSSKIS